MRQLGFQQVLDFPDLLHDPALVGFDRGDALIEAVDVGRKVFGRHGGSLRFTITFTGQIQNSCLPG